MDNLSSHHAGTRDLNLANFPEKVFLPPYCPEFNPIENWFSELKNKFKKSRPMCKSTQEVKTRIETIIMEENYIERDFSNYFEHARDELLKKYREKLIGESGN